MLSLARGIPLSSGEFVLRGFSNLALARANLAAFGNIDHHREDFAFSIPCFEEDPQDKNGNNLLLITFNLYKAMAKERDKAIPSTYLLLSADSS